MNSGHLRINVKDGAGTKVLGPTVVAAGLGAGIWSNLDEVSATWALDRSFTPGGDPEKLAALKESWARAVAIA